MALGGAIKRKLFVFLGAGLGCLAASAVADDAVNPIGAGQLEVGPFTGILSVEDFGSEVLGGLELTYHLRDRWLLQASYGRSEMGRAAFESSRRRFLSGGDRDFEYLAFTGAYRLIRGRSFLGSDSRFYSDIRLLAGPERVSFAGSDEWGINAGLSYRVAFSDRFTANVDFREHIVERDFIGDDKTTFNTELRLGLNMLF
ncbi:outer membrane beta-barrel domain-containing protein [Proteobacteria bacterium 005FR1]|nr:outer membrane beta-barrel domain-containing protein [Proteobacteria bacterium 005FR1]